MTHDSQYLGIDSALLQHFSSHSSRVNADPGPGHVGLFLLRLFHVPRPVLVLLLLHGAVVARLGKVAEVVVDDPRRILVDADIPMTMTILLTMTLYLTMTIVLLLLLLLVVVLLMLLVVVVLLLMLLVLVLLLMDVVLVEGCGVVAAEGGRRAGGARGGR